MIKRKTLDLIVLALLIIGAIGYFVESRGFQDERAFGSEVFPIALAVLLFSLSTIKFIQIIKKDEKETFTIKNFRTVLGAILCTSAFILFWQIAGLFYFALSAVIFVLIVIFNFRDQRFSKKEIGKFLAISVGFTLLVYLFFGRFMNIIF